MVLSLDLQMVLPLGKANDIIFGGRQAVLSLVNATF